MTEHLKLNSLPPLALESIQGKGIYKMAGLSIVKNSQYIKLFTILFTI